MRSQSKGIGSADNSASIRRNVHTIPALLDIGGIMPGIRHGCKPSPACLGSAQELAGIWDFLGSYMPLILFRAYGLLSAPPPPV
jgi:hypothetical protein